MPFGHDWFKDEIKEEKPTKRSKNEEELVYLRKEDGSRSKIQWS